MNSFWRWWVISSIHRLHCGVKRPRRSPSTPWWRWWDSNPWPPACRAGALPAELHPQILLGICFFSNSPSGKFLCLPFFSKKVSGRTTRFKRCLCTSDFCAFALVGPSGLEPPTSCLSGTRSNLLSYDPMWLVWFLSHLDFVERRKLYASFLDVSVELSSRTVARKVFSPLQSLTSVFGMGTGGPSAFVTLTSFKNLWSLKIEQH